MKRTIVISTRGLHLSKKDGLLDVSDGCRNLGRVSFEDLGVLVVESTAVTMTSGALHSVMDAGGLVVVCGHDHHPSGFLLPLSANTLYSERLRAQAVLSEPMKKRLWQRIIKRKLACQAGVLGKSQEEVKRKLLSLSKGVRSGDPENYESQGARYYWRGLLGDRFRRDRLGPHPNQVLNYGYTILRAAMARAVVAAGLTPGLGIHHHNRYNAFCLVDDLVEPFRPWVDVVARDLFEDGVTEVVKDAKVRLLEVLTATAMMSGRRAPLSTCIDRTARSFAACVLQSMTTRKAARKLAMSLVLPEMKRHEE